MEENLNIEQRKQKFRSLKKFFKTNLEIKQKLLNLAPTELDDIDVETRMQYTDKLFNALNDLEIEFDIMIREIFGDESELIETVKNHFSKSKGAFEQGHYNQGDIQKLYREQFSNMCPELVEKVKEEFVGYTSLVSLPQILGEVETVNELLHVMHSYIQNDNDLLASLPVLKNKVNEFGETITLYGEETETAKKLFEGFSEELDVGTTDIVSFKDKILMMIRDRGHALTVDIDIKNPDEIAVTYFVPKICNEEMIRALPGINTSSISSNGATGFFLISTHEVVDKITDFIEKVPTDMDRPEYVIGKDGQKVRLPIYRIEKGMLCRVDQDGTKVELFRAKEKDYRIRDGKVYEVLPDGELIEIPETPEGVKEVQQVDGSEQEGTVFNQEDAQYLAATTGEQGPRSGMMLKLMDGLEQEKDVIMKNSQGMIEKFRGDGDNDNREDK